MKKIIKKIIKKIFIKKSKDKSSDKLPLIKNFGHPSKYNFTHISAFTYGNAGDTLLPIALQDTFNFYNGIKWNNFHVHQVPDEMMLKQINNSDALIIGGGGLFLTDTNKNNLSGWQWPCNIESLSKINVPIVLFAVGYNRFRNQEEFQEVFKDNIRFLTNKSAYIGLRNFGSIKAIKEYLPIELHQKVIYQPCMTTFLYKLYGDVFDFEQKEDFIAFNAAFDRSHLRFGEKIGDILSSTARVLARLSKKHRVVFYSHMQTDEIILPFLDSFGVKYEIVRLQNCNPKTIITHYIKPKLVIGMRGHAQMIPFGCVTPIVSIVSHNKMQWFLNDIQKPEWGADVESPSFESDLERAIELNLSDLDGSRSYIKLKQDELFTLSVKNTNDLIKHLA